MVQTKELSMSLSYSKLKDALLPRPGSGSQPQRQMFVLYGFGGIGKTQLAITFARKYQKQFSAIFWLDGSTKNQVLQNPAGVARRLSNEVPEARTFLPSGSGADIEIVVEGLLRWLSQAGNNSWLLIFDNVDRDSSAELKDQDQDAFDVTKYFPSADHGSILITTRLSKFREHGMRPKSHHLS
ncbi:hypothetical protein GJ744_001445 [Endocarpon pusillum]|uniref:NB-ARC domain-containing protein n=1 Tax=Endocarpon pusillum TaxID=364733 RepID=A0A8H7AWP9_9EURO|nr:hypothetical protein GJ744_001445 [Endocarpon pusillum]